MGALLQEIMADETRKTEELRVREKLAQQKRDRRLEKYHQEQNRLFGLGIKPRPRSSGQIQGQRSMSESTLRPQSAPTPAGLQRAARTGDHRMEVRFQVARPLVDRLRGLKVCQRQRSL